MPTTAALALAARPRPPVGPALDRAAAATTWLVVGGESRTAAEAAGRVPGLVLGRIDRIADAAGLLEDGAADAVLLDAAACDDLPGALAELRAAAPAAAVVVASDRLDVAEAVEALRGGAADYLPAQTPADEAAERMRLAAGRRWLDAHTDRRLLRLKSAVRQLNRARRAVGRRVDLLCGDLVGAYGDVAEQVERVRQETTLTDLLGSANDLEQLLCHAMDWLLRHAGHCNIAVFLEDDAGGAELGAYMKHTVAGEEATIEWLRRSVLPAVAAEADCGAVALPAERLAERPNGAMAGQAFVGAACTYLAEPLATIVLFRPADEPFAGEHRAALAAAAGAFARALTCLVHGDEDACDDSDAAEDGEDGEDWWKRGQAAPF